MGAIHKMIKCLETQVREAKDSMNDARQYGVNSAGFNAYLGQFEMATTLLEEAQRLAEEEAQPKKPVPLPNRIMREGLACGTISALQGVGCGTTDEDKCPECGSTQTEDCVVCLEDGQDPVECPVSNCGFIKDGNHPSRCSEGREGGKCLSCGHTWRD